MFLFSGSMYYFICEKWLAVEEQDGKVEREFMALEGPLEFTKVLLIVVDEDRRIHEYGFSLHPLTHTLK